MPFDSINHYGLIFYSLLLSLYMYYQTRQLFMFFMCNLMIDHTYIIYYHEMLLTSQGGGESVIGNPLILPLWKT